MEEPEGLESRESVTEAQIEQHVKRISPGSFCDALGVRNISPEHVAEFEGRKFQIQKDLESHELTLCLRTRFSISIHVFSGTRVGIEI
jgi:hypothetical protein